MVVFASLQEYEHLLKKPDGLCWMCRAEQANSREHRFKKADLRRLWSPAGLIWGSPGECRQRLIRGIERGRFFQFDATLCHSCNTTRTQGADRAYDVFAAFVARNWPIVRYGAGVDLRALYGGDWLARSLDLGRYYAKHFGCRLVRSGLPVPDELRDFATGGYLLANTHFGLVYVDSIARDCGLRYGLSMSGDMALFSRDASSIEGVVMASYVGPIGVRYEWRARMSEELDSFMSHPVPVLNKFRTEQDVFDGNVRFPGFIASVFQVIGLFADLATPP